MVQALLQQQAWQTGTEPLVTSKPTSKFEPAIWATTMLDACGQIIAVVPHLSRRVQHCKHLSSIR